MSLRGVASAAAVAALVALIGVTVDAQFKVRLPKSPSVPGVNSPAPAPAANKTAGKSFECSQITDELVDNLLEAWENANKATQAAQKAYEAEMAKAAAKKAEADAIQSKRGQQSINVMMQNAECKDAFKEKDPRSKDIARLEEQVAAADEAGDEKKSDALHKKLSALSDPLELDADRACGGKGSAALHDCMAAKKAALAKQGIAEPMLTIQAQGECMSDPATSGMAGMTGETDEEKRLRAEAADIEKQAREKKAKADEEASGKASEEAGMSNRERAIFLECCIGVRNNDPVWLAKTPPAARAALAKPGVQEKLCK
jgi:hypothetical protein